ncbi:MAG TPA: hypothetical protein VMF89_10820 [Polyangiales bacterium]|nr:hypothetical protein [Polyangiales bacterium]
MDGTIPRRAAEGQRAHGGVRSFSERDGDTSVGDSQPAQLLDAGEGGRPSHVVLTLEERIAEDRARDLACAAAMDEEEAWIQRDRERLTVARRVAEEKAREQREELARAERRSQSMRSSLERATRLMRQDEALDPFAGFADPDAARAEADAQARKEAQWRDVMEHTLAAVRGTLGQWTPDSEKRFEQTQPETVEEEREAKRLGRRGWALTRLGVCGSLRDLGYVLEQIRLEVGNAVLGCWVVEAMGLRHDGTATRQLHSSKARRKLFRSYVLWRCGSYGALRDFAGSPSTLRVRGVKRCPQRLLARVLAVGSAPWSRATTTRDANEAHAARLWKRTRLPQDVAPAEERAGASGQVVSRYVMHLPSARIAPARADRTTLLAESLGGSPLAASETPMEWVARHAVRLAMHAVDLIGHAGARATAPPG